MKIENLKTGNMKIIFMLLPFIFGIIDEWAVCLVAIIFMALLVGEFIKNRGIKIYFNYCFFSIFTVCIASIFTCIWGVDRQEAVFGVCRMLVLVLFTLLMMQQDKEKIRDSYKLIYTSGSVMVLICMILRYIPYLSTFVYYENKRMAGFFQYPNVFALYLLIGLVVLLFSKEDVKHKFAQVALLAAGIILSGSRTVFILAVLVFALYFWNGKNKKEKKIIIMILGIIIIISLIIVYTTNSIKVAGRFLTISLNSSTLWGRIIYYKDALELLKDNIFGYGHKGYSYIYRTVQTAHYGIKYVHCDFLQIALDYGIIPMIAVVGSIVHSIFSKRTNRIQKISLIVMFLHMMVDFDLQFLAMYFVLIAMQDLSKQKDYEIIISKKAIIYPLVSILALGYSYIGVATFAEYSYNDKLATKMLPHYTSVNKVILMNEPDLIKANELANRILDDNKYVQLAYNIKAAYEIRNKSYDKACEYVKTAIEYDRYNVYRYEYYVEVLATIIERSLEANNTEDILKYMKKETEVPEIIKETENRTTWLAERIRDSSKVELNHVVLKYIDDINKLLEKEKGYEKQLKKITKEFLN